MITLPLNITGGGRLEIHGPWPSDRMLVIIHRDVPERDELLITRLIEGLKDSECAVIRYETGAMTLRREINMTRFARWPRPIRRAVRLMRLVGHPGGMRHIVERCRYQPNAIEFRTKCLRALIALLGRNKEISILGRSAGGRAGTLVADECKLRRVICLGYPFQKPGGPDEPARYEHLATLKTPCLIVQGRNDPYGSAEIVGKYRLSGAVQLKIVNTDHDFRLPDQEWTEIMALIRHFAFGRIRSPRLPGR